eukprot:6197135-Pleurochrysis_carterae.AAC.2
MHMQVDHDCSWQVMPMQRYITQTCVDKHTCDRNKAINMQTANAKQGASKTAHVCPCPSVHLQTGLLLALQGCQRGI